MSVYYSCVRFVDVIQSCPQQWSVVFSYVLLFASLTEIKTRKKLETFWFPNLYELWKEAGLPGNVKSPCRKVAEKMKIQFTSGCPQQWASVHKLLNALTNDPAVFFRFLRKTFDASSLNWFNNHLPISSIWRLLRYFQIKSRFRSRSFFQTKYYLCFHYKCG